MGCASSKPSVVGDGVGTPIESAPSKRLPQTASSSRELREAQLMNRSDSRSLLIDRKTGSSIRVCEDRTEKSRVNPEDVMVGYPGCGMIPNAREGEQVVAGWPLWLVTAAGDAIMGWIPRHVDSFQKLDKIGEGTYSSVYKARDLINGKTVALKRVRFDNLDSESVKFMAREIVILRRLDHPNIIKLEGIVTSASSSSLYLIFEYMEHDLTGLASLPSLKFTEPQVKCYMQQLLSGLEHCHSNGILHRDIKGSNLLIDDSGTLKIADFGLATFFNPRKSLPLTSRVVTLWYRPPELLLGATHYGVSVDLWSAGCILGELYAGKPIMPGRTEVEQLHKIFKLCGSPPEEYWERSKLPHSTAFKPQKPYRRSVADKFHDIPAPALALIETLLSTDPASRGTAASALRSEFFTTEPLACDPSTLPKYPPSKEIDARRREEEIRRHQAFEVRHDRVDLERQASQKTAATLSAMKLRHHSHSRSRNVCDNHQVESTSGTVFDSTRNSPAGREVGKEIFNRLHPQGMYSGSSTLGTGRSNAERKLHGPPFSRVPNLSTQTSLAPNKTMMAEDSSGCTYDLEGSRILDKLDYFGSFMGSCKFGEKTSISRPSLHSYAPDDDKIHLSGPLLHPSKNLDQILKEHERRIQAAARVRMEKFRHNKMLAR